MAAFLNIKYFLKIFFFKFPGINSIPSPGAWMTDMGLASSHSEKGQQKHCVVCSRYLDIEWVSWWMSEWMNEFLFIVIFLSVPLLMFVSRGGPRIYCLRARSWSFYSFVIHLLVDAFSLWCHVSHVVWQKILILTSRTVKCCLDTEKFEFPADQWLMRVHKNCLKSGLCEKT